MLRIDVISIFPEVVEAFASTSLIGKARLNGILDIRTHDPRDMTADVHRTVDDSPFGGGAGMVLKPEPIFDLMDQRSLARPLIYLGPSGRTLSQTVANELAGLDGFSLLCGRFEGIDERIRRHLIDDEISIGDYVLAGGEVAAAVIIETVGRLVPGVLGNRASIGDESFAEGLLEYPHYTRPAEYRGWPVPEVLRSGDHGKVARWRRAQSLRTTLDRRPDLIECRGGLSDDDRALLIEFDLARPGDP